MKRTKDQVVANAADRELFRLIVVAEEMAKENKRWREVSESLRDARPPLRMLMHEKDREDTI